MSGGEKQARPLQLVVDGGFESLGWEPDPVEPSKDRLVLRANPGGLKIDVDSFDIEAVNGTGLVVNETAARLVIDHSGRLSEVIVGTKVSAPGSGEPAQEFQWSIKVVVEAANVLYRPVTVTAQNVSATPSGNELMCRFDLRFDSSGARKPIRWLFFRYEVMTGAGYLVRWGQGNWAQYIEIFAEVHQKNTVRVRPGVTINLPLNGAERGYTARGVAVGIDSDGLLITYPLTFSLTPQ